MRRQLLFVAVGARQRVLATEILDMAEPVAEHALRQPAPEMRADTPEDHADFVFRVVLDREATDHHEAASILDLGPDFLDDWLQGRNLEMFALQIVEAKP